MKSFYYSSLLMFSLLTNAFAATHFTVAEQAELVTAQNKWRSLVNVPMLRWSSALADTAQRYADTLGATTCQPIHSETKNLGENLYWASPFNYADGTSTVQTITPAQAVAAWTNEKIYYHHAANACAIGKVCGHYTQIVWKNTTEVGCGKAICQNKAQIWVCNYTPAGNYIGQKPY